MSILNVVVLARIEAGEISSSAGSHIAGVFGKAATSFEKAIRSFVSQLLTCAGLDYEPKVRRQIKGPAFDKLTLGQLIAVIEAASQLSPDRVAKWLPSGYSLPRLLGDIREINHTWVQIKHGEDAMRDAMVASMRSM